MAKKTRAKLEYKGETLEKPKQAADTYIVFTVIGLAVALFALLVLSGLGNRETTTFTNGQTQSVTRTYADARFIGIEAGAIAFTTAADEVKEFSLDENVQVFDQSTLPHKFSSADNLKAGQLITVFVKNNKVVTIFHD